MIASLLKAQIEKTFTEALVTVDNAFVNEMKGVALSLHLKLRERELIILLDDQGLCQIMDLAGLVDFRIAYTNNSVQNICERIYSVISRELTFAA